MNVWKSAAAGPDRATFEQVCLRLAEKNLACCESGYEGGGLQGKSGRFDASVW